MAALNIHPPAPPALSCGAEKPESVVEARAKVLRALDAGLFRDNEAGIAFRAMDTMDNICTRIVDRPKEARYRRLRSRNPFVGGAILTRPGGVQLMLACGFRTRTIDLEEFWVLPSAEDEEASETELAVLREALDVFADARAEKLHAREVVERHLAGGRLAEKRARERTEQLLRDDKRERKERVWVTGDSVARI